MSGSGMRRVHHTAIATTKLEARFLKPNMRDMRRAAR